MTRCYERIARSDDCSPVLEVNLRLQPADQLALSSLALHRARSIGRSAACLATAGGRDDLIDATRTIPRDANLSRRAVARCWCDRHSRRFRSFPGDLQQHAGVCKVGDRADRDRNSVGQQQHRAFALGGDRGQLFGIADRDHFVPDGPELVVVLVPGLGATAPSPRRSRRRRWPKRKRRRA